MPRQELDSDLVRTMAALLDETGLTELEYATQALRVRVARNPAPSGFAHGPTAAPIAATVSGSIAEAPTSPPAVAAVGTLSSPMVGTIYIGAEPGSPPFVKVGDNVRQGQTLLIIEAMKVMNPLPAPRAGRVLEMFVTDGQPVEFGEPLLVID